MAIDSSIAMQTRGVQLNDPLDSQNKLMQIQAGQSKNRLADMLFSEKQRDTQHESALAQAYKQSVGEDGAMNRNKLYAMAANAGLGAKLPGIQKAFADQDKVAAETADKKAAAQKTSREDAGHQFEIAGQMVGAWANNPGVTKQQILSGLHAAMRTNVINDSVAQAKIDELGSINDDPASLGGWAKTTLMQVMKAKDQFELSINQDKFGEEKRKNKAQEANARSQLAVAQGNLGVSRERLNFDKSKDAAVDGVEGSFSPAAIDSAAARYNLDGTLPPMGMGKSGALGRSRILNRAAEIAGADGTSPEDQRIGQIANKANTATLSKLQQQQTMVGAFERNFMKNADIVEEFSSKVDRTGVPILNKWINAGKRNVGGDPELAAFDVAVKAVSNEYAKIISGSMGNTATAQGEIAKVSALLAAAQTPEQVTSVVNLMRRETQNRMTGFEEEKSVLRTSMSPKKSQAHSVGSTAPVRVSNATDYAKVPSGAEYITPDGQTRRKQ